MSDKRIEMKFNHLYQKTINYYPSEIDVSDGRIFEQTNGFISNNLSNAWDRARTRFENEWEELLIWNIYQMLDRKAKLLYKINEPKLMIVDAVINLSDLEKEYLEALQVVGYEDMLEEYLHSILLFSPKVRTLRTTVGCLAKKGNA